MRVRQLVHTRNPLLQTRHRAPHPLWPRAPVEIVHFLHSSSQSPPLLIVHRVVFGGERSHSPRQYGRRSSLPGLKTPFHRIFTQHFPTLPGKYPPKFFSHPAALRKGHCLVKCLRSGMNAAREASLLPLPLCTLSHSVQISLTNWKLVHIHGRREHVCPTSPTCDGNECWAHVTATVAVCLRRRLLALSCFPIVSLHGVDNGQNQFGWKANGSRHLLIGSIKKALSLFSSWTLPRQPLSLFLGLVTLLPHFITFMFLVSLTANPSQCSPCVFAPWNGFFFLFFKIKLMSTQQWNLSLLAAKHCYLPTVNFILTRVLILTACFKLSCHMLPTWLSHLMLLYLWNRRCFRGLKTSSGKFLFYFHIQEGGVGGDPKLGILYVNASITW